MSIPTEIFEVIVPVEGITSLAGLVRNIEATLRGYWNQAERYQRFLYASGILLIASGLFHVVVYMVKGGVWGNPVSWRKPIIFGFSTGLTCISISWILTFLPQRPWLCRVISYGLALAFLLETVLVDMQQWRGVPSHFNNATPFDSAVFNSMGAAIGFVEIIVIVTTLWTFFSLKAPASLKWSIWIGMALLVVSQVFGNLILFNGFSKTIDLETGMFISEGVKSAYIFGAAGSIKVSHALTLHAVQVLPLLGFLLLFTTWNERRRTVTVMMAAAGYTGIVAVSTVQTFAELVLFDMSILGSLAFWMSVLTLVVTYAAALVELRQTISKSRSAMVAREPGENA